MTKREEDSNIPQLGKVYYTDPKKYDTEHDDEEILAPKQNEYNEIEGSGKTSRSFPRKIIKSNIE